MGPPHFGSIALRVQLHHTSVTQRGVSGEIGYRAIAYKGFRQNPGSAQLISLSGQPTREITVKDWNSFTSIDWAADGKGFFVSSNSTGRVSTLLYVDLMGNAHSLWQVLNFQATWAIPSHNGKYEAIPANTIGRNAWMLDNF
jgi:hypothetical protein